MKEVAVAEPDNEFSLLEDPPIRLQRALRLAPRDGFAAPRRALLFLAVTWLPIVVWAVVTGHLQFGTAADSALRHLGVHARCLLGIPLFILSEPLANTIIGRIVSNFVPSGLIREEDRPRFSAVLRSIEGLRDSSIPWIVMVILVVATAITAGRQVLGQDADALVWGPNPPPLDFGGAWALFVVRPLYLLMLLGWVWRLILTWLLFRRIARLDLQLVPSHPDRVGGLGFIELHSVAFALVVLSISSVVCAAAAHQILHHGVHFKQVMPYLVTFVIILVALFIAPLTAFSGKLRRIGLRAKFDYGTLAGRHVRGLHARWVEGHPLADEAIMSAPEIGPAADVATLYDLANRVRIVPFGKFQIGAVLAPALGPALLVATAEVPLTDILQKLVGMLM